MLQIATQAQAAQVRIAEQSGRPKFLFAFGNAASEPARQSAARFAEQIGRLPAVTVINDPAQIKAFEQKLLGEGG